MPVLRNLRCSDEIARQIWDPVDPGDTFWYNIDSQTYPYARGTYREDSEPHRCIAANSRGERCQSLGVKDAPFCGRHFDKAMHWMIRAASRPTLNRYHEALSEAREALTALNRINQALDQAEGRTPSIYFYLLPDAGLVKIGTSINVHVRVREFAKGKGCIWPTGASPEGGQLLGTIPGGHGLESGLHLTLRAWRRDGEWFVYSAAVRKVIDTLLAETEVAA